MKIFTLALGAAILATTAAAIAQTTPQTPSPAPSAVPGKPAVATPAPVASPSASPSPSPTPTPLYQFSGYTDLSYTSLSGATSPPTFISGVPSRVFDTHPSTLDINAVDVAISHNSSGMLGGKLEVLGGTDANVIQSYAGSLTGNVSVMQAYFAYTGGLFTWQAGKFVTLAGAEVIQSPQNLNFSRGILFGYAVPFTHTGVRLTYAPNSTMSFIAGVNNGWDQFNDTNGAKTLEGGFSFTPSKIFTWTLQGYSGKENLSAYPVSPTIGNRGLIDTVFTYHPNNPVTLTVNYDTGSQGNAPLLNATGTQTGTGTATWNGIAGYAAYAFPTLPVTLAFRGETFHDAGGYRTGLTQTWSEQTFTVAVNPIGPLTIRGEYRTDSSNVPAFRMPNGLGSRNQHTFGVEAFVKFSSP